MKMLLGIKLCIPALLVSFVNDDLSGIDSLLSALVHCEIVFAQNHLNISFI